MNIRLGFGKTETVLEIDKRNLIGVLGPNKVNCGLMDEAEVKRALLEPIDSPLLRDIVRPEDKIAIITSDITRPMPTRLVLPEILRELFHAGVKRENVTVVFALGSHRMHTEDEKRRLVGDHIFETIRCIDSEQIDYVHLGYTSRGTPVDIFRPVVEADKRVCLGNIEYHYFAGYSGGAKAIMPGVSTRTAIQANHSRMVENRARTGIREGNPVRTDIDEVAQFISIDFILNVVVDEHKQVIKAVAGHYLEAHKVGCRFLDSLYKVAISAKADIVIVSAGGYPKDINLYQAQKALDNAAHAVKLGGVIILVASCWEGFGEDVFERWIREADSPHSMVEKIRRQFELGGHKAAAIGMVLDVVQIYLVSELADDIVRDMFMEPFPSAEMALSEAYHKLGCGSRVLVMPFGGSTLPVVMNTVNSEGVVPN